MSCWACRVTDSTCVLQEHAFNGIELRPLAPVHLTADRQTNGDLNVGWIRRTRIDGDSWQSVEVPLGEEVESYIVRVMAGSTEARQETVTSPGWIYTAAKQAADGVSFPYHIDIAQVSNRFGPGLCRRQTIWS